jgi:mannose/fructose/N-acetylgalactosamine-specific phosphotransferase system component IIB
MAIVLTLVDERLIHGSVTGSWVAYTQPKFFVLAHDETANDPDKRMIMEMAAPPNTILSILTIEETGTKLLAGAAEKGRVMLLLHNLYDLDRLLQMGVNLDTVSLSHILHKPDREERRLSYGIHVGRDEEELLIKMMKQGVKFEVRPVPTYKSQTLESILKKK